MRIMEDIRQLQITDYINNRVLNWGDTWASYINQLPKDPKLGFDYVYSSPASSNGQTYYLYASLEIGNKDAQACNGGNACTSLGVAGVESNACGGVCNFGLSSPNVSP